MKKLIIAISLLIFPLLTQAEFVSIVNGDTLVGDPNGAPESTTVTHFKFNLSKIPEDPKLQVKFKVKTTGSCPNTYENTGFFMNGNIFAEIDFRKFHINEDKVLELEVPADLLEVGENDLEIDTGACQFGVDSMVMNSIKLE